MKLIGILIVHTKEGILPTAVQRFQMKKDKKSGRYNHSMLLIETENGLKLFEASYKDYGDNKGKYIRAGAYINDLEPYLGADYEMELLIPKFYIQDYIVEDVVFELEGTPYDFSNLLIHQILYYTIDRWIGRTSKKAKKRMVCHELTMNAINKMIGKQSNAWVFLFAHRAQIKEIFHNDQFEHMNFDVWYHKYKNR